jgi:AcrR family transcriptional regulator
MTRRLRNCTRCTIWDVEFKIFFPHEAASDAPIGQKQRSDPERRPTAQKIDRRVARTRGLLHQALLSLILEKSYESISVEEICERANIGRSTFYAHFTGKDDLKRSGLEHLRRELLEQHRSAAASMPVGSRPLGFSLAMFEHARDHMHLYRRWWEAREVRSRWIQFDKRYATLSAASSQKPEAKMRQELRRRSSCSISSVRTWPC